MFDRNMARMISKTRTTAGNLPRIVDEVLSEGVQEMRAQLAAGTPIVTGKTAGAWADFSAPGTHSADNPLPHVPFIDIDRSKALKTRAGLESKIRDRIRDSLEG